MESGRDVCPVHTYDQTAMLAGVPAPRPPLMMLPGGLFVRVRELRVCML